MKRILTLCMLLLPLVVCAQSDLYRRYAAQPNLTVAQVCGFKLSDDVKIDVVMVQGDNAEGWSWLMRQFGLGDSAGVSSWLGDRQHPERHTRWTGGPVARVVVSHEHRTVGIYCLENEEQYDALIEYQMTNMAQTEKKKK